MSQPTTNNLPDQNSVSTRLPFERDSAPQLLISVRNREEARLALKAGVKILDVKEPDQGSLGQATPQVIEEIGQEVECDPKVTFSVALGELRDISPDEQFSKLPGRVDFVKVGLAGCGAISGWRGNYKRLRNQLTEQTGNSYGWVAVIYADFEAANSPPPSDILDYAIENNLSGVLIDTYEKNGHSLLNHFSLNQLSQISQKCGKNSLFLALAGSLAPADLPSLFPLNPQIIAVRGAVCSQNNRRSQLDPARITELQAMLPAVQNQKSFNSPR